jgi:GAF domain-containing protein
MSFENLKPEIEKIISQKNLDINHRLTEICELLQTSVDRYDWVGFYFKNGDKRELILKAFAGEPTDHTIIPFGKGICGQVAESNQNFVVDDVTAQDNYIACSINVKSEVVIPLFVNGENIGQIDIDSHTKNAFSKEDEDFLAWVNAQVSRQLES